MSPEAIERPDEVDARSDLYAVGAVGYFLLTGTPVFSGASVIEIIQHQAGTAPEPPSHRLGKTVTSALEELLLQCLTKSPNERPQSAAELVSKFATLADELPWSHDDARSWWFEHFPSEGDETTPDGTRVGSFDQTIVTNSPTAADQS